MSRADEVIERLQAEIVRRDARIAELEKESIKDTKAINDLLASIHELKAQQPSAGVVLPDLIAELKKQADEIAREGHAGWGNTMLLAAEAISAAGVVLPDTKHLKSAIDGLPDSYSKDDVIYGWQEALELTARLNPCRAQSVPTLMALREAITPEVIDWLKCGLSTNGRLIDGTHPALEKVRAVYAALQAKP